MKRIAVAVVFSLWGLYLRAQCLAHREWWIDETNQWHNTIGPLKPFWLRLPNGERTYFPGDYLLTWPFVQIFGYHKWGVAIPHIIATVIGFYFLYLICQRYLKSAWGLGLAFLIYGLNSQLIFSAFELRPYAVLSTLGLAIFYCTETIVCSQYNVTPLKKILIGILFFLTILYHAYGILIVACCALFSILNELTATPLRAILKRTMKFYITVGIFSFPLWYWFAAYNIGHSVITADVTFDFIPNPLVNTVGFLKSIFGNLMGYKPLYPLLAGPALALVLPHPSRLKYIGFFLALVVVPISLLCVMDVSMSYWFLQRQFIWVISLFSFFVAWGWEAVISCLTIR